MLRRAAALVVLAAALAIPARAPAAPAKQLGAAWRAYQAGDYQDALRLARAIDTSKLENPDYVRYVIAQCAYFTGDEKVALAQFRTLAVDRSSRFYHRARWRVADTLWRAGQHDEAARAYAELLRRDVPEGDGALARFRIAAAAARRGDTQKAVAAFAEFRRRFPAHALEPEAEARLLSLGGAQAAALSPADRIARAQVLRDDKDWHLGIAELARIDDGVDADTERERDFWTAMTLFSMRRQYERAGRILLGLYERMGPRADQALFHGARALSRADLDLEAIKWYRRVVEKFPSSRWAHEAAFLSGWLHFNLGNYREGLPYLADMRERYPRSRFAVKALWYQGMSHFLLGEYDTALGYMAQLAKRNGKEVGGKGQYWHARTLQKLGRQDEAVAEYRALVGRYPFSWYALLARARLDESGIEISPFGDEPPSPDRAPAIAEKVDESLARDPLVRRADELIAAGLGAEAGRELERGERAFLRRHEKPKAMAMLLERYRRAGNFNRPWMLAVVHGSWRALNAPPEGKARVWWEHAFPLAYRNLVEKYQQLGASPPYYLYTIMRKESGFDPHTHSYADAQGLLQMIPPTTKRVARELGFEYTADLLFDPEHNIHAGAWYIGRLLAKFKGQIPIGSGSYNCGPRPVMEWLERNGDRPMDEFVELVSYSQTRNYMRRVTEIYARYLYLYESEVYEQPLSVDADYVVDELTY